MKFKAIIIVTTSYHVEVDALTSKRAKEKIMDPNFNLGEICDYKEKIHYLSMPFKIRRKKKVRKKA